MRLSLNPTRFVFTCALLLIFAPSLFSQLDNAVQGPVLGKEDTKEEELFKKLEMPQKRPKLAPVHIEAARRRYKDLASLYDELGIQVRKKHALELQDDPKQARKKRREIEKLDRDMFRIKREMVREARKLRRPLDRELAQMLAEKEKVDARIEAAEKSGNEKRARAIAQDFARRSHKIDSVSQSIDYINYFLFWDEFLTK